MNKDSVTISLETYNEMQRELTRLREEVKQKTIVKYQLHESIGAILGMLLLAGIIFYELTH